MQASEDALELLAQMMQLDPGQRITAAQALQHRFFSCDPLPSPVGKLPKAPVRASNPLVMEPQVLCSLLVLTVTLQPIVSCSWPVRASNPRFMEPQVRICCVHSLLSLVRRLLCLSTCQVLSHLPSWLARSKR